MRAAVSFICVMVSATAAHAQFDARAYTEQYWVNKGFSLPVAQGIGVQVAKESGGDPAVIGDSGSSLGLFQHHADRMARLLARIENDQAFAELMGEDPIAATHFDELKTARTPLEASKLWQRYFERPRGTASPRASLAAQNREVPSRSTSQAAPEVNRWDVFPDDEKPDAPAMPDDDAAEPQADLHGKQ